jgi:hypothetical protein
MLVGVKVMPVPEAATPGEGSSPPASRYVPRIFQLPLPFKTALAAVPSVLYTPQMLGCVVFTLHEVFVK